MIKADMNSYMKKNLVDILISIATATRVYTPVDSFKIMISRGRVGHNWKDGQCFTIRLNFLTICTKTL